MSQFEDIAPADQSLLAAGFAAEDVADWRAAVPTGFDSYAFDCEASSKFWQQSAALLNRLPPLAQRSPAERAAADRIVDAARHSRIRFMRDHSEALYDALTESRSRFLRVDPLLVAAGQAVPGLVPTSEELAAENGRLQRDRSGLEIDQGLFLSAVLANERAGRHLCQAMLLPRPESVELLGRFQREGTVELAGASVRRDGKAGIVIYRNPRFLNAEDRGSLDGLEICVDLVLLDNACEVAVLRGGPVDHPKYGGRRVFGAGINLTHLYHGRIPYSWYLERDLGYVNKIFRGLASADDAPPDEFGGASIEKPWIAGIEAFAIGGHCQVVLVCDHVIAERDAFLSLPARKEGIIPGAANLRMPRFCGDRIARQSILLEKSIACDSAEGRLFCDEIVAPGAMDAALERAIAALTGSGVVSAAGNRRALRIGQEPFDLFRSYMAIYAREQAYCHFSPALISNLERFWNAQDRKP